MLSQIKVLEVQRMIAEGRLSFRQIARLIGISRASISAIASGKRPDYEQRRAERAKELEPLGPLERCRECGGMVYTPCRLCRANFRAAQQEAARTARQRRRAADQRLLAAVKKANAGAADQEVVTDGSKRGGGPSGQSHVTLA